MISLKRSLVMACVIVTISQVPAFGTLVSVATPGNLLALLPVSDLSSSSSNTSFGGGLSEIDDNFVNTANQDNGLIFADSDTDQRFAITGFKSYITDIRLFLDPTDLGRFPQNVTIYAFSGSTTSLNASSYGETLLGLTPLLPGSLTPVAGAHAGYIDFLVAAPVGTQSLLFDFGSANGEGDRISEVQAFAVPEPSFGFATVLLAAVLLVAGRRLRSHVN